MVVCVSWNIDGLGDLEDEVARLEAGLGEDRLEVVDEARLLQLARPRGSPRR